MTSSKRMLQPEREMDSKPMNRIWFPCFLLMTLALMLAACSNAGPPSGSSPTPVAQATTPPSQPGHSTPAPDTGTPKPSVPLTWIRMLDTNNGWALTATSILKTSDGGVHWNDVTPGNAALNQYARGDFLNQQSAWIAIPPSKQVEGPGINILYTTDGGQDWHSAHIPDPLVATIDVPHFLDTQQGWLEASSSPGAGHAGSDLW